MTTATEYPRHYADDAHARASAAYRAWLATDKEYAFPVLAVQAASARYLRLAGEATRATRARWAANAQRRANECVISAGAPDRFGRPYCAAHQVIAFPTGHCSYAGTRIAEPTNSANPLTGITPPSAERYRGIAATGETIVTYSDGSWSALDWTDSRAANPQRAKRVEGERS